MGSRVASMHGWWPARSPLDAVWRQSSFVRRRWDHLSLKHKLFVPYVTLTTLVFALAGVVVVIEAKAHPYPTGALVIISAVVLSITVVAALLATRSVAAPVDTLLEVTKEVAGGRLDVRASIATSDEFGELAASINNLIDSLSAKSGLVDRFSEETLQALAAAIDARDPYTYGHSMRVAAYSQMLARLAKFDLRHVDAIQRGCLVHDIGKIGVPDRILRKDARLTSRERAKMREHPVTGHRMVSRLAWNRDVFDVVLRHHERWDGNGYPSGLKGRSIPRVARVVAIADTLDAMTSRRPYRAALSYGAAVQQIVDHGGSQFDPALIRVFARARDQFIAIAQQLHRNGSQR